MNDFNDNEGMNSNLNVRVITEHGDVLDFEATPDEVAELKERVHAAFDNDSWSWIRIEKDDGRIEGIAVDEMCAIRIRPYGRGEQFPDSKFVEFNFVGGGFIRAVCEAGQASSLEHLMDDAAGGIIEWNAGAHEILVRTEAILRFVIDRHEERPSRPRQYDNDNRGYRNNGGDNRQYDNRRNNDRRPNRGGGRSNDRRPHSARSNYS